MPQYTLWYGVPYLTHITGLSWGKLHVRYSTEDVRGPFTEHIEAEDDRHALEIASNFLRSWCVYLDNTQYQCNRWINPEGLRCYYRVPVRLQRDSTDLPVSYVPSERVEKGAA